MNWQEMLKDKRFLAAAAVAAAAGVFMLLRKKTGASGDAEAEQAAADQAAGGGKAFNTSGTDMASWISAYTTSVLDALREMQKNQQPAPNTPPPTTGGYVPVPRVPWVPSEPVPSRLLPRTTPGEPVPTRIPVPRM